MFGLRPPVPLPATRVRDPLRRPLAGLCLCFLLGTGLGLAVALPAVLPGLAALTGLVLALGPRGTQSVRTGALWGAVVALAALSARIGVASPRADELSQQMQRPAETLELRGVIAAEASMEERDDVCRVQFPMRVREIRRTGAWAPASGRVRVRWRTTAAVEPPRYGDVWEVRGVVRRPDGARRFVSAATPYRVAVEEDAARRLSAGAGSRFHAWCLDRRQDCARVLSAGLEDDPETAGMLRALLLGYRDDLPASHEQVFARTGMLHVFAVSGLHVGVVAALTIVLLQALGLPRYRWALLLAPLLILYTVLTGMQPPAVRACVMALLYWSAPLFWRRPDGLSALALACVLVLAADATQLTSPGFLLSFTVAAGLVLLGSPAFRWVHAWGRPDPFDTRPSVGLRRFMEPVWKYTAGLIATSGVAWICSMPLLAATFHMVSPVGLLGNLVVVPMAFVIVLTGCLSLLSGGWCLWLSEVFNHANGVFFDLMLVWIDWMDRVPAGHQWVPAPSWGLIALWFAGWLWLPRVQHAGGRAAWWGLQVLGLCAFLGLLGGPRHEAQVIALEEDVALVWIERPSECALVLGRSGAWGAEDLVDSLCELGIDRIHPLLLTQGAPDLRLVEALAASFEVSAIWTPRALPAGDAGPAPHARLLRGGDAGFLDAGSQWEVLYPQAPSAPSLLPGLVLRLGRGATSVLFVGTGGHEVQDAMCAADRPVGADYVVCARGADRDLVSRRWLRAVQPQVLWTTAGTLQWRRDEPSVSAAAAEREGVRFQLLEAGERVCLPFDGNRSVDRSAPLPP